MTVQATISRTSASAADCLMPVAEGSSGMPRSREFVSVSPDTFPSAAHRIKLLYMMQCVLKILTIVMTLVGSVQADGNGYIRLFNGKDLTGWSGDRSVWSVRDGAITGTTTADAPLEQNTFLIWQGGEFTDFNLELEYRIVNGNSGIQYRSQVLDPNAWVVGGYQADIDSGSNYTGILYEEQGRGILAQRGQRVVISTDGDPAVTSFADAAVLQQSIRPSEWNHYAIVTRGRVLRHVINGQVMSETVDYPVDAGASSGILALQVHKGPPMTVQFRNIRLKREEESVVSKPESTERQTIAQSATPVEALSLLPGFHAELLYSVPRDEQGSWVAMTVDPNGRLITSDEGGHLYRVTPPVLGDVASNTRVERLDKIPLGMAQGLAWANDSLYVVVNGKGFDGNSHGLYRVRDTDGDGDLDKVQRLRRFKGAGEHGPHAVLPGPKGKSLYVIGGNHTLVPEPEHSLVPRVWGEDYLLSRLWDASGHAVGILAPGGWICRTDPEGKSWELVSIGYRNPYDLAFNKDGELFTYDADMEWDIGAPWFRPTRVCHVTSGSDFGWRSGSGKWPAYFPDSLPATVNIGTGSPTGITFGYGGNFPQQYRDALFICDWSFGKLYAVHLEPSGATYRSEVEEFLTGAPLPLTDVVLNPSDGAMYFTIGGRNTQSGLYRVTYDATGAAGNRLPPNEPHKADTAAVPTPQPNPPTAALRRRLEQWHGREDSTAIDMAWPYLNHPDRFVRYAARIAIESQPVDQWQQRALAETRPRALIETMVALARHGNPADGELPRQMVAALDRFGWSDLSQPQQLALMRAYGLILIRLAPDDEVTQAALTGRLDRHFPAADINLNRELSRLLSFLGAPAVVDRTLSLLAAAPTQEGQIHYIYVLRSVIAGASLAQQRQYFRWFQQAHDLRGGHSLEGFLQNMKKEAAEKLSEERRQQLADVLKATDESNKGVDELAGRPVVKKYTVPDVLQPLQPGLRGRNFAQARRLFATAQCFKCHRVGDEGGATGPDLTAVGRRFSHRDLVEAIIEPNKVISDRYRATTFVLEDGRVVSGRVANLSADQIMVVKNMLAPGDLTSIDRHEIESFAPVATSEMPAGLLNTFTQDEILDLMAYLISGGDRDHEAFRDQ